MCYRKTAYCFLSLHKSKAKTNNQSHRATGADISNHEFPEMRSVPKQIPRRAFPSDRDERSVTAIAWSLLRGAAVGLVCT